MKYRKTGVDVKSKQQIAEILSNYDIQIHGILQHDKMRRVFSDFLKKKNSEGILLFYIDLNNFHSLQTNEARYHAAKKMMNSYIIEGSPFSIITSNAQRQNMLRIFDKCTIMDCPKNIFDELRENAEIELEDKHLPKFLTSDAFVYLTNTMIKKDPQFLSIIGTPRTPSEILYSMNDDLTEESTITEDDAEVMYKKQGFMYDLNDVSIKDDDFERLYVDIKNTEMWRPVYKSEKKTTYVSKSIFFNGKKGIKKMLETGVVPFTVDEVFNAYTDSDYTQLIEKEISSQTQYDYIVSGKYALSVVNLKYKLRFPLQNRDFSLALSSRREENGAITMLRKSIIHSRIPHNRGYIRGVVTGGIMFEKVAEGLTRYTQSFFVDYGGWITPALFNKLMEFRDNAWHDALAQACLERRIKQLGRPTNSWSVVQTLEHHERYINYRPK